MLRRRGDLSGLSVVEVEALNTDLSLEACDVLWLPRSGENAPAPRFQGLRRAKPDARGAAGDENAALRHQPLGVLSLVAARGSLRRKNLLLDALEACEEDIADLLASVVVGGTIGVEGRVPMNGRAVRVSLVFLDPEFCLIVLHRQRALYDLVAVAGIVGLQELLFDGAAVLQRQGAEFGAGFLRLLAISNERVPVLDRAKATGNHPDFRRQRRRVDLLLDLQRVRKTRSKDKCRQRSKT